MRIFLLLLVFASSAFAFKINIIVDEGLEDYTIPNEIVKKLKDSRLYDQIGTYGYWKDFVNIEGDYIIDIYSFNINGTIGNTTTIDFYEVIKCGDKFEYAIRLRPLTVTFTGMSNHRNESINALYDMILKLFPKQ